MPEELVILLLPPAPTKGQAQSCSIQHVLRAVLGSWPFTALTPPLQKCDSQDLLQALCELGASTHIPIFMPSCLWLRIETRELNNFAWILHASKNAGQFWPGTWMVFWWWLLLSLIMMCLKSLTAPGKNLEGVWFGEQGWQLDRLAAFSSSVYVICFSKSFK